MNGVCVALAACTIAIIYMVGQVASAIDRITAAINEAFNVEKFKGGRG